MVRFHSCRLRVRALILFSLLSVTTIATATDLEQLTDDGRLKRDPIYWPDGKSVVYTVEQPSGRMKLVRLHLAQQKSEFVHDDENVSDREMNVAADANTYTYNVVTGGKGIDTQLVITRLDSDIKLHIPIGKHGHWPDITRDGSAVVFSEIGNKIYICRADFDSSLLRADEQLRVKRAKKKGEKGVSFKDKVIEAGLLRQITSGLWPRFSPDGRSIAFASTQDADLEIYRMPIDGKESDKESAQRLTESRGIDGRPAWSPDGKQIAFTSNRDGNLELYVMNADGTNQRRLTNHPERDDFPTWHPDGNKILFVGERNGSLDLYTIDVLK